VNAWWTLGEKQTKAMAPLGVSNKTADPTHPTKPTEPEPATGRPDYLAVNGRSLPSQTDSGGLDGGSSLPKSNPPDPTMYIT